MSRTRVARSTSTAVRATTLAMRAARPGVDPVAVIATTAGPTRSTAIASRNRAGSCRASRDAAGVSTSSLVIASIRVVTVPSLGATSVASVRTSTRACAEYVGA